MSGYIVWLYRLVVSPVMSTVISPVIARLCRWLDRPVILPVTAN